MKEVFKKVNVNEYLARVKKEFFDNPNLWYEVIIPREIAEKMRLECNGDYSLVWHEHCCDCFKSIDNMTEVFYMSEDESEWLCENCYKKRVSEY